MSEFSRIAGAVYGQAVGDALGMPSELWPRERVKKYFGEITGFLDGPPENSAACYYSQGQFTDDTAMALAVVDAVIEQQGMIDPALIARHILTWANSVDAFNKNILGPSSKVALKATQEGVPIAKLENNGLTNGAAMRIAPVASMLATHDQDDFIDKVYQLSSATHKSDVALAGAVAIAWAVARAVEGESWSVIRRELPGIAAKAQTRQVTTFSPCIAKRIELGFELVAQSKETLEGCENIYHVLGAGTLTIESVPAALAMVELADTNPNTCALLCANLGGDTDTIGAMATAICGALHGIAVFNPEYVNTINRCNDRNLDHYIEQLYQLRQQGGERVEKAWLQSKITDALHKLCSTAQPRPVFIVGSAFADLIVNTPVLPKPGEDVFVDSSSVEVGGCALNVLRIHKRLGLPSVPAIPIGQGQWAGFIRNALAAEGIVLTQERSSGDNGWCVAMVENSGERTFLSVSGVETDWTEDQLAALNVPANGIVYISGYQLASKAGGLLLEWLETLPDSVEIVVDPGPGITGLSSQQLHKLYDRSVLLTLNRRETALLAGHQSGHEFCRELAKKTGNQVIYRVDKDGTVVFDSHGMTVVAPFPAAVIDTIGAGDAHTGGLIYGLAMGLDVVEATIVGNAIAAHAVEQLGASSGLSLTELTERLRVSTE